MTENKALPSVLYLYCNTKDLVDIITHKHFMLSDVDKLDGYANVKNTINILIDRLKLKRHQIIMDTKDNADNDDSSKFNEFSKTIPLMTLIPQIEKYQDTIIPFFYVLSFSSNCNKPSMYDKNSSELCVGIKTNLFSYLMSNNVVSFKKVCYDTADLERKIDAVIEQYLDDFVAENPKGASYEKMWNYIHESLIYDAIAQKNDYFRDEQEYRLIINSTIRPKYLESDNSYKNFYTMLNNDIDNERFSLSKLHFKVDGRKLIPYRYFGFPYLLMLIDSIYINPTTDISPNDIGLLLYANNFNISDDRIIKTIL